MSSLLERLPTGARRGSKPRCHWMTHGDPKDVAARLTQLIAPFGSVSSQDNWMPEGFEQTDEAELHKAIRLLGDDHCAQIRRWWFAVFRGGLQTGPSFDIASTCTVNGANAPKPGILLVEAKAHDSELIGEERGKPLEPYRKNGKVTSGQRSNHNRIGEVIQATNKPFTEATTFRWSLSREARYQMSNRFASACKLVELGHPVILVYLGFLNAKEMLDRGSPIETHAKWDLLVKSHSEPLFPAAVWNQQWTLHGQSFVPLIRSVEWLLNPKIKA